MAFTVREFRDLVGLLEQHPEWRAEIRRLVLSEELLTLPQVVRDLAEAQRRTEQRVTELAEAQRRTEQRVAALVAAQQRTEQRIGRLQNDVGDLKGMVLEERYRDRAVAYFSPLVRRSHVIVGDELAALLEDAVDRHILSEQGAGDVARADVIVRGLRRDDGAEVYLVVEVSWGVGPSDVERAVRRAALLTQTGTQAIPVVAGESIVSEAAELSRVMHVWQVIDGQVLSPYGDAS
jgi:hypothetical protein